MIRLDELKNTHTHKRVNYQSAAYMLIVSNLNQIIFFKVTDWKMDFFVFYVLIAALLVFVTVLCTIDSDFVTWIYTYIGKTQGPQLFY